MNTKLAELMAQKAALEQTIGALQTEERAGAIAKVREIMSEYGLTPADIAVTKGTQKVSKDPGKTTKVAAKYRDSVTGNSWSGRGLKPRWLSEALSAGKKVEDFLI
jgi:DNA-binding protein H-NS